MITETSPFNPSSLGLRGVERTPAAEANQTLDQQDFLTLLVTQLKTQDPLNPLDNESFVAQLAQFSTVSGITETNTTLASLKALGETELRNAAPQWLGRRVELADGRTGNVTRAAVGENGTLTLSLNDNSTIQLTDIKSVFIQDSI